MRDIRESIIVTADWHLTDRAPRCRDEKTWMDRQHDALRFVFKTAKEYNASVVCAGDVFDRYSVEGKVLCMLFDVMDVFRVPVFTIAGNHDLHYRTLNDVDNTSYGVFRCYRNALLELLERKGLMNNNLFLGFKGYDYGSFNGHASPASNYEMAVLHQLTFKECIPPQIKNGTTAAKLLQCFSFVKYVIVGDNHHPFTYQEEDRWVVNPGALIRHSIDLRDVETGVYLLQSGKSPEFIVYEDDEVLKDTRVVVESVSQTDLTALIRMFKESSVGISDFTALLKDGVYALDCDSVVKDKIIRFIEEMKMDVR